MAEPRVSVLIVARDEADNLDECLRATRWAFERVVVVDAASRDATLDIALREADKVAVRAFDDFASQRNFALALASGEWVFAVDADERSTPEQAAEIAAVVSDPELANRGYRVPIRSVVLGRRFGYSGTQFDLPLRLFRRDSGCWTGLVHETVALEGTIGTLSRPLEHHTLPDARAFLAKINEYTSLEARALVDAGVRFRLRDLVARPAWVFLKLYLFKQGFRDGLEGFLFCCLSGVSAFVRACKHRELSRAAERSAPAGVEPAKPWLSRAARAAGRAA